MTPNGMSYVEYVVAAYAIFVVVLLWDLITPLLGIRRTLRKVALRVKRSNAKDEPIPTELQR